jgi:RNA recognition motif-containing protein
LGQVEPASVAEVEENKEDVASVSSSVRGGAASKFTLFIKNLSLTAEEEDIQGLF